MSRFVLPSIERIMSIFLWPETRFWYEHANPSRVELTFGEEFVVLIQDDRNSREKDAQKSEKGNRERVHPVHSLDHHIGDTEHECRHEHNQNTEDRTEATLHGWPEMGNDMKYRLPPDGYYNQWEPWETGSCSTTTWRNDRSTFSNRLWARWPVFAPHTCPAFCKVSL